MYVYIFPNTEMNFRSAKNKFKNTFSHELHIYGFLAQRNENGSRFSSKTKIHFTLNYDMQALF